MNKATPSVNIADMAREAVTGPEAAPTLASHFVNFRTSNVDTRGGGPIAPAKVVNALLPLWERYEKGRFRFLLTENSGDMTDATVGLFGFTPEGKVVFLGESSLNASGQFDPLEIDIEAGMVYAIRVTGLTFATAANIDVEVLAQAFNAFRN